MTTKIGVTRMPVPKLKEKAILPFGKFEGEYVEDVPTEYLQWLVNQPRFREQHKKLSMEIDNVLDDPEPKGLYFDESFEDDGF